MCRLYWLCQILFNESFELVDKTRQNHSQIGLNQIRSQNCSERFIQRILIGPSHFWVISSPTHWIKNQFSELIASIWSKQGFDWLCEKFCGCKMNLVTWNINNSLHLWFLELQLDVIARVVLVTAKKLLKLVLN